MDLSDFWDALQSREWLGDWAPLMFKAAVVLGSIVGTIAVFVTLYLIFSLPMRRRERASLVLDLIENGLNAGRSPEKYLAGAIASNDRIFSRRFFSLASQLSEGRKLADAIAAVPGLLPSQVASMLSAGSRIGNLGSVIPACRTRIEDSRSRVNLTTHTVWLAVLFLVPLLCYILIVLQVFVFPKLKYIAQDLGPALPAPLRFAFHANLLIWGSAMAALLCCGMLALSFSGGGSFRRWIPTHWFAWRHHVSWLIPWKRTRGLRDFTAVFALLLDAKIPETDSVRLAAQCAGHPVLQQRADAVCSALQQGMPLAQALRTHIGSRELGWRLENALKSKQGFVAAVQGWLGSLDAKAFQLEQAAGQGTAAAIMIASGVVVALAAYSLFSMLTGILDASELW